MLLAHQDHCLDRIERRAVATAQWMNKISSNVRKWAVFDIADGRSDVSLDYIHDKQTKFRFNPSILQSTAT